ncbi:MAG: carbohydrate-binding domain-containing protein [Oscillospiraceae bacterium]|nr:carbohydrate-binding domain-containing protein [Oscillospiraceae bacterium]
MKSRFLTCCGVALGALIAAMPGQFTGAPLHADAAASGDLDGDGKLTAADVRLLQNFLLTKSGRLSDWQAADFDGNRVLNAADLSLMKREVPEEEPDPAYIHLKGSSISYEGSNVTVSGKTATITASGVYYIDGKLDGGQVIVQVPDESTDTKTVKLYLNGVEMKNSEAPCIMIENAENTSVNLVESKTNTLSDGTDQPTAEEPAFAVLHAKDDLTIKGVGSLEINAGTQYGIHCNNDLKINGGTLTVTTQSGDAVRGRTSVTVKDGVLNIDTAGDGIKSTKGNMAITGGEIKIKSNKDALQAETDMELTGGTILACGDRGLTAEGSITADGCTLLATATDNACEKLGKSAGTMQLSFTKEWKKNNPIALLSGGNTVFDQNTLRKFRYAVVSDPAIASGACKVYAGGIEVVAGGKDTFSGSAEYTDVNNAENPDLLYKGLFDKTKIHKIEVKMDNWKEFISRQKNEEVFFPCDLVIDGEELKNVAIRSKGNSSRMSIGQSGSEKYSYRFKLDEYDEYVNYHGLTEFCLNNFYNDPTCMRDILCYDALHEVEGVGPSCAYTDMYLNGELFSFYIMLEQPGKTLAERLAVDDNSILYKATERTGGGGGMFGGDSYCSFTQNMKNDNFDVKFGTDDNYTHIEELKQAINKLSNNDYKFIEDIIDVPSFLKGFAVNSVMCNYDSYNGTLAHNYYLMYTGGKFYFVGWDYNLSLGAFMGGADSVNSDVTTSLYSVELKDRPLAKLVQVPAYHEQYISYVKQITQLYNDPEQYVKNYVNLIGSHVQADPRNLSNYQSFQTNTAKTANGLGGQQQQGGWPGGGWGFPGGGGGMFGGGNISVVDFLIRRNEVIHQAIG